MSQTEDRSREKYNSIYPEQNLIEDEEESATLAEPMTLEGAKQLAQSVNSVPTPTSTPPLPLTLTPPLSHPLQMATSPPLLSSPTPPPLHHLPSPISSHHHSPSQAVQISLTSPRPLTHIGSPVHHSLTSPPHHISPAPHLPQLHHDHGLWVPPAARHDDNSLDEEEESDLPSTVDIRALRDSPSPDPSGKLVTINENWDSLEDHVDQSMDGTGDDDSDEEDDYSTDSSDTDSKLSDSESNHSNCSTRSLSTKSQLQSRSPSVQISNLNVNSPATSNQNTKSESDSDSCDSKDSKSERDSQDSDSDSSGCSSSDEESNSSSMEDNEEEVEEDEDGNMVKSLPRPKPQLTASNLGIAKPCLPACNNGTCALIAKGKLSDLKCSKFQVTNKDCDNEFLSDSKSGCNRNILKENFHKLVPLKKEQKIVVSSLSKEEESHLFKQPLNTSVEQINKDNAPSGYSNGKHTSSQESLSISKTNDIKGTRNEDFCLNKEGQTNNPESSKVESTKSSNSKAVNILKLKEEPSAASPDLETSCDNFSLESKELTPIPLSKFEMEERRLEKKKEMDREFDRLLKSTNQINLGSNKPLEDSLEMRCVNMIPNKKVTKEKHSKITCEEKSNKVLKDKPKNVSPVKQTKNIIQCPKVLKLNNVDYSSSSSDEKSETVRPNNELENKLKTSVIKTHSSKESLSEGIRNDQIISAKHRFQKSLPSTESSKMIGNKSLLDSSNNKVNKCKESEKISESEYTKLLCSNDKASYLTSTSSSESEDSLPSYVPKRTPSLNVTAKVITECSHSPKPLKSAIELKVQPKNHGVKESTWPPKTKSSHIEKLTDIPSTESWVRPTIADVVKVRERRSSFEREGSLSSGGERERKGNSGCDKEKKLGRLKSDKFFHQRRSGKEEEDETTSSSETSDELNEKIDVDTEQTQTFSVSESQFNQGRLTMRIAAMKMAKFGKTGLKEVTAGGIPTRSDLHSSPLINLSGRNNFKRPRLLPKGAGPVPLTQSSRLEPPKIKTAAERKTYVDALPPCGSICHSSGRGRKGKGYGLKGDVRVPGYRSGQNGTLGSSLGGQHNARNHSEVDEISRIAQTLSQISHEQLGTGTGMRDDHLSNGLQVLDQEDLAAILPDVSTVGGHPPDVASSASLDPFRDNDEFSRNNDSDSEDLSSNEATRDENLLSIVLPLEEAPMHSLSNVFGENVHNNLRQNNLEHSPHIRYHKTVRNSPKHIQSVDRRRKNKSHKACELPFSVSKDNYNEEDHMMPELESYIPLDCNVSNVSPDSGIQSVNGSPLHHVGSPSNHHSPFYSNNLVTSGGSVSSSLNSTGESGGMNGENPSHMRPFSPLNSHDSPPPPTLLPAVTPPHLASSPHYNYDESGNSPPMPSLKCQIEPPLWEENNSSINILEEQGSLNERGPGRPDVGHPESTGKVKRSRGRPKGSKNKKKEEQEFESFLPKEKKPIKSFIREPSNAMARLGKSTESSESLFVPEIDYSSMKHKWRGTASDPDDLLPATMPPVKRGPGRPKKVITLSSVGDPRKLERQESKSIRVLKKKHSSSHLKKNNDGFGCETLTKVKRPVGRPRKHPKLDEVAARPISPPSTLASKKCFSDRIMHKIINEKVRNSEKSDKLSVQQNEFLKQKLDLESSPMLEKENKHATEVEKSTSSESSRRKYKFPVDGIPLEDKRKKRGRKKLLPKIFEKVYGSIKSCTLKTESPKALSNNLNVALNSNGFSHKKKKKKRKKQFKSKHKNIVDPVFLAEVEVLSAELQKCIISKSSLGYLSRTGDVPVPAIFRIHTVLFTAKKRRAEKSKASDKESGAEGDSGKDKLPGKRKKKLQEVPKQGRERSEANEQRLPLKKRHRHISTAVPTSPDPPKLDLNSVDIEANSFKPPTEKDKLEKVSKDEEHNTPSILKSDSKEKLSTVKTSSDLAKVVKTESCKIVKIVSDTKPKELDTQKNIESCYEDIIVPNTDISQDSFNRCIPNEVVELLPNSASLVVSTPNIPPKLFRNDIKDHSKVKKTDSSAAQSLASTTPKKRHRLEAELSRNSDNSSPVNAGDNNVDTSPAGSSKLVVSETNESPSVPISCQIDDKLSVEQDRKINEPEIISSKEAAVIEKETIEGAKEDVKLSEIDKEPNKNKSAVEEKLVNTISGVGNGTPEEKETDYKIITEEPLIDSKRKKCEQEDSGTHSDSDIPSEHEPLYESDQSGFMSDKECSKIEISKAVQKRKKKKKDFRLPDQHFKRKNKVRNLSSSQEVKETSSSLPKKKAKRRKTNKTGFPTVKKKKKKPQVESEDDKLKDESSLEKKDHNLQAVLKSTDVNDLPSKRRKLSEESPVEVVDPAPKILSRPRGRPPKKVPTSKPVQTSTIVSKNVREPSQRERKPENPVKSESKGKLESKSADAESQFLKNVLERVATVMSARTRNKRDLSEESNMTTSSELKRPRKLNEEEIDDSDSNVVLSECHLSSEPASSDESCRSLTSRKKVPRWKKKFLVAGLFSDYFKQNEIPRKNGETSINKLKILNYDPEEHPHKLLPPPCYCKKWLRERHVDFTLPYDLWWLHTHNMLPGRDLVPSWNYKRVKSNVYYDVKPNNDGDVQSCNCKRPVKPEEKGCGEDCINRMMFIECSAQACPISDCCSNQRIQRHENLTSFQRFMTTNKGWGIKTKELLKAGTFILEYVGEVVSEKEFKRRMQTRYSSDKHHYCLNLDRGMVIDGHRMGGDCRFVNHSCDPNCEMQKWHVNGQYRMALFALKEVKKGEELTYDYNFSLFNPTEGQICKCGSDNCRGVIGGRSQRLNGQTQEEKRKIGRNKKEACKKRKRGVSTDTESSLIQRAHMVPMKPLSHQQRLYILTHRCFLLRNLEKVRHSRERLARDPEIKKAEEILQTPEESDNKIEKFLTHFTALNTARSVKTRRLAQAEDDPQMTRVAKLAQIFKDIYDKLVASRDDKEKPLATPFMTLPSKKRYPNYYTRVAEPVDLSIIEKNILTGHYVTPETFDQDIMRLFGNNLRFYGRNTEIGQMAIGLRKVYSECKLQFKPLLEEVLGENHLPSAFANCSLNEEFVDEDVIRCVCNLHRDEGMMIQCERCLVWQHCDCMGVTENGSPDHYLCEECSPRIVSPEVPMTPQPADTPRDHKYFITLLRDNLQIKQGDSVYILRDRPQQKSGERRQPAYKLAKDIKPHDMLIFKVENLWIDEKGDKFAFGHHYLRPHETFHEPWRKFFPNEVIRSPHCEILPLDMIVNHCWVMDLNTYCRGRPIVSVEDHVYVCEYRVDKIARVFSKISKPKYPICMKPFAFRTFNSKLKPQRTYSPHTVHSIYRGKGRPPSNIATAESPTSSIDISKEELDKVEPAESVTSSADVPSNSSNCNSRGSSGSRKGRSSSRSKDRISEAESISTLQDTPQPSAPAAPKHKSNKQSAAIREKKRQRANQVATNLLSLLPSKGAVDLSFLLENGKRQRKKTAAFSS